MLAELLQPAGPDLARRWLAALLIVPREAREGVVARVERAIVQAYTDPLPLGTSGVGEVRGNHATATADCAEKAPQAPLVEVVHPPIQRDGYVEQVVTTYERGSRGSPSIAAGKLG